MKTITILPKKEVEEIAELFLLAGGGGSTSNLEVMYLIAKAAIAKGIKVRFVRDEDNVTYTPEAMVAAYENGCEVRY